MNQYKLEVKLLHTKVSFSKHKNNDVYLGPIKTLSTLFVYKKVYEHIKQYVEKLSCFFLHSTRILIAQGMQVVKANHGIRVHC